MLVTYFSTALGLTFRVSTMPALERPSAMSLRTCCSRGVRRSIGSSRRRTRSWATTSGSRAVPPAATRRAAVLEQVADRAGGLGEQVGGVALLHVLGQHQQRHVRELAADDQGGLDALVGVRGRHPDVDDGQFRLVLGHRLEQLGRVRHGRDDLETAVGEHPGEPVPQQHRVLGDHDSHGSSAVMVVGPPGGLSMLSVPSTAAARWASPRRPVLSPAAGTAPPRPLSVTAMRSMSPTRVTVTSTRVAWACLTTLVIASETMK